MKKSEKKLSLEDLTVNSFVTALDEKKISKIKGGKAHTTGDGCPGTDTPPETSAQLGVPCEVEAC